LSPFQFVFGLIGRAEKPPAQFGQTLWRMLWTHSEQKVHSNVQIIAFVDSGGNGLLQFSQVGLSSSISSSMTALVPSDTTDQPEATTWK
jgi:hypothetical protein